MNFAERLQKLRMQNNLKQKDVAEKLNIKQQAISQYENATSYPKVDILNKLAEIFDVSLSYLMGNTDDPANRELPKDVAELLEIYDSLPSDKKNISIELLRVLKDTSEKGV